MKKKYYDDYKIGLINEIKFQSFLEFTFDDDIKKYEDKYAEIDFRYYDKLIELKSRTIPMKQYPTTMVGYNKILKAKRKEKKGYEIYFYFLFTDGLYKWKYVDDEILCVMKGGRVDRGCYEIKDYAYIPIKYLEFVSDKIKSNPLKKNVA